MTTKGCQECPSEQEIQPIRNAVFAVAIFVLSLFWFWYSWSPFFPTVGAYMNRVALFFCKLSTKASDFPFELISSLLQYFKIFISYLQVMSSFLGFHVAWPSSILGAMMWCKATFNFSLLSLPGISCLWKGLGYNSKLTTYTLVPIGLGFMLLMPVLLISILKSVQRSSEEKTLFMKKCSIIQDRFWNAIMFMFFLVSCSKIFHIVFCQTKIR
jgi:hypothetical protein